MSKYDSYPSRSDTNCRTCTDFKFWSKQQRQIFHKATPDRTSTGSGDDGAGDKQRTDCPLDKSSLGKATWGLLHTIAAFYDDSPTETQKRDVTTFIDVLSRIYPCEFCAKDFRKDLAENPVNANSQKELSMWLCKFHNRINLKLGKKAFDCSKIDERWRDGWLDGSCD